MSLSGLRNRQYGEPFTSHDDDDDEEEEDD
jgi:hypothetical protein